MTVWGAIGSAGIGVGVIAGGMLTTWLSWKWIFLVNVPVGAVALLLTTRLVPEVPGTRSARPLDIPGALTVVGGLSLLVYALSGVPTHGWGAARTIALLAAAAVLLVGFVAIERVVRRPLLPASVWQTGSLVSGAALLLGMTGLLAGSFYLNSLYEQTVLGWSALETGFGFLPFVAAIGIAVHAAGHLLQRFGARAVVAGGLALVVAAAIELSLAPTHASYVRDLLPGFVVLGAGVGLAFPAVQISAMADVDHERAGIASGFIQTAHEIGAALGVAVLAAVAIAGDRAPGQALAQGYGDGYLAVAGIAALLGIVAITAMTSVRPAPGAKLAMH
jgi:MFS family permease